MSLRKLMKWLDRFGLSPKEQPQFNDDADLEWVNPPEDPLDFATWDRYWIDNIRHGFGPPIFDMFCNDRSLVEVMNSEGMKTVLCAGNGISQEPKALARAGFEVVALDLSPQAIEIARQFEFPDKALDRFLGPGMGRAGGHVDYVVGDFLDLAVSPGPFDVIIERCTAQLYFERGLDSVMEALAGRLNKNGILFSHSHDGGWEPPAEPRHYTRPWLQQNQWTIWCGGVGSKPAGRVAWLFTSTG